MTSDPKQLGDFKILGPAPSNCDCSSFRPSAAVSYVSSELKLADRFGALKARSGIRRMDYAIPPGLYALGTPGSDSEVLVTANYKLTFDKLRSSLPGRDLWILVLDTKGINVWCAAGKGTFGTEELVRRIAACRLEEVVSHRRVIVPQLGAPGVAAHLVKKQSGFKVVYGPILADDLPAFLDAGRKATPEMRRKAFTISERAVLIPLEITGAFRMLLFLALAFFFLSGIGGPGDYWTNVMSSGLLAVFAIMGVLLGGAILTPLLLPWLPGKAFSLKSLPLALLMAVLVVFWRGGDMTQWPARVEAGAWLLIASSLTTFLAMNFTGASTYTSLSGVKKEMRIAVPAQIAAATVGLILWVASRIIA
ncbi:MAG: acetyl-CoA synthase subunit gamma [Deltaproteobacteria bacterium]|nr:acetyl-CoA synthase subunit gamma [Deltaproteobacteria bacterium]